MSPTNTITPTPVLEINMHEDLAIRSYENVQIQKNKIKEKKQMLKDAFENDATYSRLDADIKEQKRELAKIKETIAQQSQIVELKEEIRDMTEELKDEQYALFAHLDEYTKQTGASTIEINGNVKKIIKNFKIIK